MTDGDTASRFYGSEGKILVASHDVQQINTILVSCEHYSIFVCEKADGGFIISRCHETIKNTTTSLPLPPPFCLAMIALSKDGRDVLEQLHSLWSGDGAGFLPQLTTIEPDVEREAATALVYHELLNSSLVLCGSVSSRLVSLQRELSAFRLVHEQLQNAFDTVETFLSRSQQPPTVLGFSWEPTDAFIGPPAVDGKFELTQILPISSQGMSAIEIHIADAEAAARGTLFARVTTQEDGRLLGAWQLPYEGLGRGWYCLDLPEIDIGARQSALLWLLWLSRSGPPPPDCR